MAGLPEEQLGFHHCFHFPALRWLKGDCPLLPSPGKKTTDFQPCQPAPLFCLISCRDFLLFPRLASLFVQIHPQDVGCQQCNVLLRIETFPTQWNFEPPLSKCFKCKATRTLFFCGFFFFPSAPKNALQFALKFFLCLKKHSLRKTHWGWGDEPRPLLISKSYLFLERWQLPMRGCVILNCRLADWNDIPPTTPWVPWTPSSSKPHKLSSSRFLYSPVSAGQKGILSPSFPGTLN